MYYTGFADEAADDIDGQIRATCELGWRHIEARSINGTNINDIPEPEFDRVCGKLVDAGISVNCLGSTIANWGKCVDAPFELSLEEVKRAIPRMQRLGTKMIRIMSYAVMPDREPNDQMERERFRKLREIQSIFTDAGITPLHENCMNYGGMGWPYTIKLLENVEGLKLVFDTGNPVFTDDRSKLKPYPKQSAWEFYQHIRYHVAYIHIKDGYYDASMDKEVFTFPGEGKAEVRRILEDLLKNGYDGGISIEPHMAAVFHDASVRSEDDVRYANYIEYGRRVMRLVESIKEG